MGSFDLEKTREIARRAISPIQPATATAARDGEYKVFRGIPHHYYYLVFLLLIDLLKFDYMGRGEKVAYIIPIEFKGRRYAIVYAKFGMRIEYSGEGDPEEVFRILARAIKASKRYYQWRADQAATTSDLNLEASANKLFAKYDYLRLRSAELFAEAEERKGEVVKEEFDSEGMKGTHYSFPAFEISQKGSWTAEAAVDAFFAWSEHVLVHIAVLEGKVANGVEVADLVKKDWTAKCKLVFDLSDPADKEAFDEISALKSNLRNYVAHGSFGRDGAMFHFHTRVGAIPLRVLDNKSRNEFAFGSVSFDSGAEAFEVIDRFHEALFSGSRLPAKIYIESGLPTILSYAANGQYDRAMSDETMMESFVMHLSREMDDAANMDF